MNGNKTEISWASAAKFFIVALLILAIYFFRDLIALFISAIVIATVVESPTAFLIKKGLPRFLAVMVIYLGFLLGIALLAYLFTPVLISEFQGFTETILNIFNRVFRLSFLTPETIAEVQTNLLDFFRGFGEGTGAAFRFATQFTRSVFSLVVVFVTSFYLALQGRTVERIIRLLSQGKYESYFLGLWGRAQRKIGRWFYGQILLSAAIGASVFLGLLLLGVAYPLLIGILAGLLEIVPVVGPVITGLIAFVIAAQKGIDLAFYTIILFVIIQQVETHLLVPGVMRRSIGLNPVVVVFALLIGGKLAGLWGVILAVPLTAALGELLADWEQKRFLKGE